MVTQTNLYKGLLFDIIQATREVLGLHVMPNNTNGQVLIDLEPFAEAALEGEGEPVFCAGDGVFLKVRADYLKKGRVTLHARMDSKFISAWKAAVAKLSRDISFNHSSMMDGKWAKAVSFPVMEVLAETTEEVDDDAREELRRQQEKEAGQREAQRLKDAESRRKAQESRRLKEEEARLAEEQKRHEEEAQKRQETLRRRSKDIKHGVIFLCPKCSEEISATDEMCPHCQEELARCPHCDRFIKHSLLSEDTPHCPHEFCGKSLHRMKCPDCGHSVFGDLSHCTKCGKGQSMVDCPNPECKDHKGKQNRNYHGSGVCAFCEKKLKQCPHCDDMIFASSFDGEAPHCPKCDKSLLTIRCTFCGYNTYMDCDNCSHCGRSFKGAYVDCPNEKCLDHKGNRHKVHNKMELCPYCKEKLRVCPHCSAIQLDSKFSSTEEDPSCYSCGKSFALMPCPHCGRNTWRDKKQCINCNRQLVLAECPNEGCVDKHKKRNSFFKGMAECPFCKEELKQCPHCNTHISKFLFSVTHSRCPECHKSLERIKCPHCGVENFADRESCSRCSKALEMIDCPNDNCVDHHVNPKQFYRGIKECPHCKEAVFYCPHCNDPVLNSTLEEDDPKCPHKGCGMSLKKVPCPHCHRSDRQRLVFMELSQCSYCNNALHVNECPNEACVDGEGNRHMVYDGSKECPYCQEQIMNCPHCGDNLLRSVLDNRGAHCPGCSKSLVKMTCPECGKPTFADKDRCDQCRSRLSMTVCGDSSCVDHEGNRNRIYRGMKNCPFCEKEQLECPYCGDQILKRAESKGWDCPTCKHSLEKRNCPHCGRQTYKDKQRCQQCKKVLSKINCPHCSQLIFSGLNQCSECETSIRSCSECKKVFIPEGREPKCRRCQAYSPTE